MPDGTEFTMSMEHSTTIDELRSGRDAGRRDPPFDAAFTAAVDALFERRPD